MNASTSSLEASVDIKNSVRETTQPRTSSAFGPSFSSDSDAIAILHKRRLRRGRAMAATAASSVASRGHTLTR